MKEYKVMNRNEQVAELLEKMNIVIKCLTVNNNILYDMIIVLRDIKQNQKTP